MKAGDAESLTLALHALIGGNARLIVEHVLEKASSGHIGYIRYVFDALAGPRRPTAEDEMTADAASVIVADDGRADRMLKAA